MNDNYGEPEADFRMKYIDPIFDKLELDKKNPKPAAVPVGKLLNAIKNYPRWTYRGSLTTPPCTETVNWNVIDYVFPIKKEHLDLFKGQLAWQTKYPLKDFGNWRVINEINEHQPMIVFQPGTQGNPIIIPLIILIILTVIFFATTILFYRRAKSATSNTSVSPAGHHELADYDTSKVENK